MNIIRNTSGGDKDAYSYIDQLIDSLNRKPPRTSSALKPNERRDIATPRRQHEEPSSETNPASRSILARPYPVLSGLRTVPRLISANGVPFLRYKKPQPPALSRVINDRIRAFEHRLDRKYEYQHQVQVGKLEDAWYRLLSRYCELDRGVDPGPSWSKAPSEALDDVMRVIRRHAERTQTMAMDMYRVMEKERALAEKEKLARRDERHRRNKAKRLARREAADIKEPTGDAPAVMTGR